MTKEHFAIILYVEWNPIKIAFLEMAVDVKWFSTAPIFKSTDLFLTQGLNPSRWHHIDIIVYQMFLFISNEK